MADGNKFKETVESLFQGMDSVVSSKTVVGDAIHINGTIILPLVDVSFGVLEQVLLTLKRKTEQAVESVERSHRVL